MHWRHCAPRTVNHTVLRFVPSKLSRHPWERQDLKTARAASEPSTGWAQGSAPALLQPEPPGRLMSAWVLPRIPVKSPSSAAPETPEVQQGRLGARPSPGPEPGMGARSSRPGGPSGPGQWPHLPPRQVRQRVANPFSGEIKASPLRPREGGGARWSSWPVPGMEQRGGG